MEGIIEIIGVLLGTKTWFRCQKYPSTIILTGGSTTS